MSRLQAMSPPPLIRDRVIRDQTGRKASSDGHPGVRKDQYTRRVIEITRWQVAATTA